MSRAPEPWGAGAGHVVVKQEADYTDVASECVKQEPPCEDSAGSCGVSEAAAWAGLYTDHVVKDELVLGPECLQRPKIAYKYHGASEPLLLRECRVLLERVPRHGARGAARRRGSAGRGGTDPAHSESDMEKIIYPEVDYEKEPRCDLCGRLFELKCQLVEHVMVHIHMPASGVREEGGPGVARDGASEPLLLRECRVLLERVPRHGARGAARRRGSAGRGGTDPAHRESDMEKIIYPEVDYEKEPRCDLCGRLFELKCQLVEHVMVHIHMPASGVREEGGPGVARDAWAGSDSARRTAPPHTDTGTADLNTNICSKHLRENTKIIQKENKFDNCGLSRTKKSYPCKICSKNFTKSCNLTQHLRTHKGIRPYSCEICKKTFNRSEHLITHKRVHTGERPYSCDICHMSFSQSCGLRRHTRTHTGEKPYACGICNKRFADSGDLKKHGVVHTDERPLSCEFCKKTFKSLNNLKLHEGIHADTKRYACEICDKRFRHWNTLISHNRVHTGEKAAKPYSCEICNKKFRDTTILKIHTRVHTGDKPYRCDICGMRFTAMGYLKKHARRHTGLRPYSCEVCKKGYTCSQYLKRHQLIHTGERPYSCTTCKKAYAQSSELKRHERTHLASKPYSCEICKKKFTELAILKKHKRIHTGETPYTCEICKTKFTVKGNLKFHQRFHTGEKMFTCKTCSNKFFSSYELHKHKRTCGK